jgi:hypothetical protein
VEKVESSMRTKSMKSMRTMRRVLLCLPSLSVPLLYLACGSRTGLLLPEEVAAEDAGIEPMRDATAPEADAPHDVEAEADAPHDAIFRDVPTVDLCPDAASTLVYLLTEDNVLLSFDPPTLSFTTIGDIACPGGATPFSMAVDRRGIAYSVFLDGNLFRIDTASAACEPTTFVPDQNSFLTFGMGYVADTTGTGETLFVAEANVNNGRPLSRGLAHIDTLSYALDFVGAFGKSIPGPELTGTGDGRLFAFFTNATGTGAHIVQVDKTSAALLADYPLQVGAPNDAYAFAYWGGVFWVFTSTGAITQVTRFDPLTASETPAITYAGVIVGAGVSTCAPQ